MIGVLIVTHGRFGEALLEAARMISRGTEGARALGFLPGQGVEDLDAIVRSTLAEMGLDDVLFLVDLPGGSPARVVAGLVGENPSLEALAGVNLPMLVEVLLLRDSLGTHQLAKHAAQSGHQGIVDIGAFLRSELAKGGQQ